MRDIHILQTTLLKKCPNIHKKRLQSLILATEPALNANAAAVTLAHNHPSGVAEPSQADKRITTKLVDTIQLIGCAGARSHRYWG